MEAKKALTECLEIFSNTKVPALRELEIRCFYYLGKVEFKLATRKQTEESQNLLSSAIKYWEKALEMR